MKKASILFGLVLFLGQFSSVQAQDDEASLMKGTETAVFQSAAENNKCLVFGKYAVKIVAGEDLGEDIEVYRRAQSAGNENACQSGAPYFEIKNADANYFAGLSGDYLFVDNGTGTDGRSLEIYDLRGKKSIYSTEYFDELELQQGKFVLYDKLSPTKGALKNCRQAAQWKKKGFGIGWVRQSKLDLQTLKETPVGAIRCRAFQ